MPWPVSSWLCEAVGEDPLAVTDGPGIAQAGEQHLPGYVEEEFVTGGHRGQQRGQFQVLDQVLVVGRQGGAEVEVAGRVEEVDLHDGSLRRSRS
jgi:hypothetical protein